MELLNPTALFGLLMLPLLLIPYLVRRKPRRMVFSSLLLFLESGEQTSSRPWGKLHLPAIFFLQLLLLALLILALSEPVFSIRPTNVAIVLDNSASMQAIEEGKSRFTLAQEKARALASELGATGKVDLYMTTPRLEKIHGQSLAPAEAAGIVNGLAPYDLGEPPADYDNLLSQLARGHKYERVYLITDHPARGQSATLRVVTIGQPRANIALTGLEIQRSSLANARLEALVEVTNYSEREEKLKVHLKSNGAELASKDLVVGAGKTATTSFTGFPDHAYYQAEIAARDHLPLDDRRFAVAPGSLNLRILGITPRPKELESLKAIPGIQIDIIAPTDYEKFERTGYSLEIFHFAAPATLPSTPTLFILPPESSPLVDLGAPISNLTVSNWRDSHVLTRYVNFNLLRPTYARPLKPQSAGDIIIDSAAGPLAFSTERQSLRYLTLGFDPFPYLGRDNLPMSILTLNLLDWFFQAGNAKGQATGEPIYLGKTQQSDEILLPGGKSIAAKPGAAYFGGAVYQGIYQLRRGNAKEIYARNLLDSNESDLRAPTTIEIRGGDRTGASASVWYSFWPYLLGASLLLLALEWFINPRMAAPLSWSGWQRAAQRS